MILSNKTYEITGYCSGDFFSENFTIEKIVNLDEENDVIYEWQINVCEKFDEVCDMKVGDTIFININRDIKNDKAIIIRKT